MPERVRELLAGTPDEVDTADLTIVIPTFNEGENVAELVRRLGLVCDSRRTEVLFVDDSTDDTPDVIRRVGRDSDLSVRLLHRPAGERGGGLSGAVVAGLRAARADVVVVMDGDLQHPPELVPVLADRTTDPSVGLVVASRHLAQGSNAGLDSRWRHVVSDASTMLAKLTFPRRVGRTCSDPMTGFFALRRSAVSIDALRPRGFKILLEILARHRLSVVEVPFTFGERLAGESKASAKQGLAFLSQLAHLRLWTPIMKFAMVGALGLVLNLALLAGMLEIGGHYLMASIVASEITIVTNFLLQERCVFHDKPGSRRLRYRFLHVLLINNVEILLRVPLLGLLVQEIGVPVVPAQAFLIGVGFLVRYTFLDRITYRVRPVPSRSLTGSAPELALEGAV